MSIFIIINIIFYLSLSIALFDLDYSKSRQLDEPKIPSGVNFVYLILILSFLTIIFWNWKYAVLGLIVYLVSGFVPLPQIIGNILMSPFKPKTKK